MERNYPFCFSAVVCEGYNEETRACDYSLQHGMGFADSYSDAASLVESFYGGDDLIAINKLELFEESSLMFFPKRVIDDYRKNLCVGEPCDCDGNPFCVDSGSKEKVGEVIYPDGRREPVFRKCDETECVSVN